MATSNIIEDMKNIQETGQKKKKKNEQKILTPDSIPSIY